MDDLPSREKLGPLAETTFDLAELGYIEMVVMPGGDVGVRMTEKGKAWVEGDQSHGPD